MFIDSHAHLTSDALYSEADLILNRAREAGVSAILNICTDVPTLNRGLSLRSTLPSVYHTGATTPHDVESLGESDFPHFEKAAREGRLIAIGETGLDYHYEHSPKAVQRRFFIRYLDLALSTQLPVIIHCRDAFDDLYAILDEHYAGAPLVLHCFTGTKEEAKRALERNYAISFSGIVTFKKSQALQEVARYVPLESILIETDSPYLAPQSRRGEKNEPAFLRETAQFLATLKGLPLDAIASATSENARRLFSKFSI